MSFEATLAKFANTPHVMELQAINAQTAQVVREVREIRAATIEKVKGALVEPVGAAVVKKVFPCSEPALESKQVFLQENMFVP